MAGLYIHIPFCKKKCVYCDFHFSTHYDSYRSALIEKISEEIKWKFRFLDTELKTIYFGGGTPSLLNSGEFTLLFDAIQIYSNRNIQEVTLEVNPEDIHEKNLALWKKHGINRLSIGVQSLMDLHLNWMNRSHGRSQTFKALELCFKSGFDNISIDLIYGLPGLDLKAWELQLKEILTYPIKHLSAYILTVEKNTTLFYQVTQEKTKLPEDENIEKQYQILCSLMYSHGFIHYEVSNFCKLGFESIHNSSYWNDTEYIGVGPSAHSYLKDYRSWNIANNRKYVDASLDSIHWFEKEHLSNKDRWNEAFLTGFRSHHGVQKRRLEKLGGFSLKEKKLLETKIQSSVIMENDDSYSLSEKKWLFADQIASEFFRINKK